MIKLLNTLISEFHSKLPGISDTLPRKPVFAVADNKIKVAIGMRRVGKTTAMLQKIQQLLTLEEVKLEQILYLNLEDDRLIPCSQQQFRELIESFYARYPQNHDCLCYLFFDEIQNVVEWPTVIRRIFDTKKVQIYLTGSSAKLLSTEIHTSLRGRAISSEVWPYDFTEYLRAHKVTMSGQLPSQKNTDILMQFLARYLEEGGFPETIGIPTEVRRQILQDYVDVVIMRDIIERHNITNISLIKYMIKTLLKNSGCSFSINKFYNDLKSQGLTSAKNTLYDYLNYIHDAYLIFTVSLYSESLRKSQTNPRKIYAIDPGIVKAYSFGLNKNHGHHFENLIYLDLKRKGYQIYYYLTKERYEVDFFCIDPKGEPKLFQVAWDIKDQVTMDRECRALKVAEQELGIKGELITPSSYIDVLGQWSDQIDFQ